MYIQMLIFQGVFVHYPEGLGGHDAIIMILLPVVVVFVCQMSMLEDMMSRVRFMWFLEFIHDIIQMASVKTFCVSLGLKKPSYD